MEIKCECGKDKYVERLNNKGVLEAYCADCYAKKFMNKCVSEL